VRSSSQRLSGVAHGLTLQHVGDRDFLAGDSLTSDVFARVRRLLWTSSRTERAAHLPRIAFALSEDIKRRVLLAEIRSVVNALPDMPGPVENGSMAVITQPVPPFSLIDPVSFVQIIDRQAARHRATDRSL
jgi:hypothetical protein